MPDPPARGRRAASGGERRGWRNAVLHALANHRRRVVLAVLADRTAPVSERTLAREVAARERHRDPTPSTDQRPPRSVMTSLVHVHLPVLVDAGLVDYTPEGVAPTDRFDTLQHACAVHSLLDESLSVSTETVDRGLGLLAHDTRRRAIEELATDSTISLHALAEALALGERRTLVIPDHVDRAALELHHVHVPKLVDAGVVTRDGRQLRYLGDEFLDEWWFTQ